MIAVTQAVVRAPDRANVERLARIPGDPRPSRHQRFLRRVGLFAVEAAIDAVALSKVERGERLGLFAAIGGLQPSWDEIMGALEKQTDELGDLWARGLKELHPFWMLRHLSNNTHALLAAELGALGEGATFGGAVSGAQAIAAASRAIAAGAIDAAVVVAADSLIEPEVVLERESRGETKDALAEAAAALVLERDPKTPPLGAIAAFDAADGSPFEPAPQTIQTLLRRSHATPDLIDTGTAYAKMGAAELLVRAALLLEQHRSAIALSTGAPGLAALVRVEAR
jgi:3-oxoacyl-[acyl-carrier-protein] synthase II